jgi:acyl-CoA reductase-like NAD-dependent aldehyde dehydrogenase
MLASIHLVDPASDCFGKASEIMAYQSVSPYTGKTLKTFKMLTGKQLEKSLVLAATCFEAWKLKTFEQRVVVAKAAAIMQLVRVSGIGAPA